MIKHIVMWKVKDEHEGMNKLELSLELKRVLEELPSKINQIREFEVGFNFNPSDAAYDVVLYSSFDSKEDLEIYQKHPDHVKVAGFVGVIRTERAVVDYEL